MDKQTEMLFLRQQIVRQGDGTRVGHLGEKIVELMLPRGWYKYQGRTRNQGDMRVVCEDTGEVLTLEVKASKKSKYGFRFNLNQQGRASCQHADFVILLCVMTSSLIVPFVIPASQLKHVSSLSIRSFPTDYRGKYSIYRQSGSRLHFEVNHA